MASPSTMTVQAPQLPMLQPGLAPVRCRSSRSASRSVRRGSTSRSCAAPLTVRRMRARCGALSVPSGVCSDIEGPFWGVARYRTLATTECSTGERSGTNSSLAIAVTGSISQAAHWRRGSMSSGGNAAVGGDLRPEEVSERQIARAGGVEAVAGNEIRMRGEIGVEEIHQDRAMFGDERVDDGVPLLCEGANGGRGFALDTGAGALCALLEGGKLAEVWRVGDKDARGGAVLKLAEEVIQVGGVLSKRHAALEVVADEPDGDEGGMIGERLGKLVQDRLVEGIPADAEIERPRIVWQARDENGHVALGVGIAGADADGIRRADGDVDDGWVDGRGGCGMMDGAGGCRRCTGGKGEREREEQGSDGSHEPGRRYLRIWKAMLSLHRGCLQ